VLSLLSETSVGLYATCAVSTIKNGVTVILFLLDSSDLYKSRLEFKSLTVLKSFNKDVLLPYEI
jgi:hypothetical protein